MNWNNVTERLSKAMIILKWSAEVTIKMSSTKAILHSCVPALTMHKYILIHHAHTAFHLHLKMSSVSLIAAHSQFSLLMDGKFNF